MDKLITMSDKELSRLEVMNRLEEKRGKQQEAADQLGISVRQVKRLLRTYREKGAEGHISKRRGKSSNNRLKVEMKQEAIELIRSAGGIAALAHPITVFDNPGDSKQRRFSKEALGIFKDKGLTGLEVVTPYHNGKQLYIFHRLAKECGLLPTGGSDDHGRRTRDQIDRLPTIPYSWVKALFQHL